MRTVFRYLTATVLCMSLLLFMCMPVYAKEDAMMQEAESQICPYNTYVKYTTLSLSNIEGKASCTASVTGYAGVSRVSIFLYLQKYSDGTWSTVYSTNNSASSNNLTISEKVSVSGGKYRLKASYYADGENIVKYSVEKTF